MTASHVATSMFRTEAFGTMPAFAITLRHQVLDRNVKVGVSPMEPRKHLLHCPWPRDGNRQWRADQRVRLDQLVDRLGDDLGIVRVHGVREVSGCSFVPFCLGCWHGRAPSAKCSTTL